MTTIERADLDHILKQQSVGGGLFGALDRIRTPEDLLRVLACYIQFNSTFGGGVANLAGEIAIRQDLFRDPDEIVALLADRSGEVASDVFFAAIDEFDDRGTAHRDTHRSLAQATLKAAASFFGCVPEALNRLAELNDATREAIRQVQEGYGVNEQVSEQKLFSAMGFHMGSEVMADDEFNTLDRFLRARYPALVENLQTSTVEINGVKHAPYYWVHIHTSVEADHFGAAVAAANRALHYYAGSASKADVKKWIIGGFASFAEVQERFIKGLSELSTSG
jgi:hypothetical protein